MLVWQGAILSYFFFRCWRYQRLRLTLGLSDALQGTEDISFTSTTILSILAEIPDSGRIKMKGIEGVTEATEEGGQFCLL